MQDIEKTSRLNELDGKEWVKSTKSWFVVHPRPRSNSEIRHPAKFPDELAERFIKFFTRPDDWVLDPFAGVGSTLVACASLGRRGVGVELVDEFAEIGRRSLEEHEVGPRQCMITGDSRNLEGLLRCQFGSDIPGFSYVITSPPYYNMLRKSRGGNDTVHKERLAKGLRQYYSPLESDLGNLEDYDEYIESVARIIEGANLFLLPSSYITIVVQNMRDSDGCMKPIAWDLARRLSATYELKQEQIWCQDNKRLGCWGYPTTYVSNVHHHYCLILQRPE